MSDPFRRFLRTALLMIGAALAAVVIAAFASGFGSWLGPHPSHQ